MRTESIQPMRELQSIGNRLGLGEVSDDREELIRAIQDGLKRMRPFSTDELQTVVTENYGIENLLAQVEHKPGSWPKSAIGELVSRCVDTGMVNCSIDCIARHYKEHTRL